MITKTIINEKDIHKLKGKYVIEINDKDIDVDYFSTKTKGFLMEKRISFISEGKKGMNFNGFFYSHGSELSDKEFVEHFNNPGTDRHMRLLTPKELKILMNWMIEDLNEL